MNDTKIGPEQLRKVMATVNQLLALADDPAATPAEAERARERAERLMTRYRIEEAQMDETERVRMGIRATYATWMVTPLDSRSEFMTNYRTMVAYVVAHVDCKAVERYESVNGVTWIVVDVFGYESDLAYGEAIWNSARITFASKLEPKVDPALTDMDNVYALRNAGMERIRIAEVMGWGTTGSATARVTNLFKKACLARGEDPKVLTGKGNSVVAFRLNYAQAFVDELWSLMYRLRSTRGADSAALQLGNRLESIMEAMYEKYPNMRPENRKPYVAPNANCVKCQKANSGYCRDHSWLKPSTRKGKSIAYNGAAQARGRAAAGDVRLGGGSGSLGR